VGKETPASIALEPERKTRWGVAASVGFAVGAVIGWVLRQDILRALVAPWIWESRLAYVTDGSPSADRLLWWYCDIAAVGGLLVALPLLVLAALSWLARRFAWRRAVHPKLFLLSSYFAVAAGSCAWALVARPRFIADERARWGLVVLLPTAYVDQELGQLLRFALAGQACVTLVMLAKAGKPVRLPA
jgi:Sec-independent protein secretion pathway component TatC